jgi:hypothetical protein
LGRIQAAFKRLTTSRANPGGIGGLQGIEARPANRRTREFVQRPLAQAAIVGEKDSKQPATQTGSPSGPEGIRRK